MDARAIIAAIRDGQRPGAEALRWFAAGLADGTVTDAQAGAFAMAVLLKGLGEEGRVALTTGMRDSGKVLAWDMPGPVVDKHSTGGIGDCVSLLLAPALAACGAYVPMISGRGLGHTGGTVDKLKSIPGFQMELPTTRFRELVEEFGCGLIAQTEEIAPADRKLYALRDVTATVECIPLICGSILSKKLAEGIDALVLDVKFGRGAFMKTRAEARLLAEALVRVGQAGGKQVRALLTAMDQPLGRAVGNALEVSESVACLRGAGPADVMEVTYALGRHMLILGGVARDEVDARQRLERVVANGAALAKFREIVAAQGGDVRAIDEPSRLPQAKLQVPLSASRAGVVGDVDAMGVALAALRLGAGRAKASDQVDPAVGVSGLVKMGERVNVGDTLAVIHANDEAALADARAMLAQAIVVGDTMPDVPPLIAEVLI